MTSIFYNISTYSRFNISEIDSDINVLVKEYRNRINAQLNQEEGGLNTLVSFAENKLDAEPDYWLQDNYDRFLKNTYNEQLVRANYLSELGYICSMIYSPGGEHIICGHSTGLIQVGRKAPDILPNLGDMDVEKDILGRFQNSLNYYYGIEEQKTLCYPMFYNVKPENYADNAWVNENNERFLKGTENKFLFSRVFSLESGYITSLAYSPNGYHIVCGHSSGLIQMRHGQSGVVLATLRNIQFPHKPIYALQYSRIKDERVCYAACTDGVVYRVDIPNLDSLQSEKEMCIMADPALAHLHTQYYGSPGLSQNSTPFISNRSPVLSMGVTADNSKMVIGYADTSVKVYDMETQEAETTYKVHKLRLQFIPKKLQRVHNGQVCAVRCHDDKCNVFASAGWEKTLRIWDTRCKVGCMMTFEGVDCAHDSIDLNREQAISGSWTPTEAVSVWDLTAHKRLSVIRIQNRRPDVDGEYIYACRYWRSTDFNRKGTYAVIGGSGTKCVEVINLHNRYIACSYPVPGTILAVASHQERIAFGGTASVFNIVSFRDPKHEKYPKPEEPMFDYERAAVTLFQHSEPSPRSSDAMITGGETLKLSKRKSRASVIGDGRKSFVKSRKSMVTMTGEASKSSAATRKSLVAKLEEGCQFLEEGTEDIVSEMGERGKNLAVMKKSMTMMGASKKSITPIMGEEENKSSTESRKSTVTIMGDGKKSVLTSMEEGTKSRATTAEETEEEGSKSGITTTEEGTKALAESKKSTITLEAKKSAIVDV